MEYLKKQADSICNPFVHGFDEVKGIVHQVANEKGWWKGERNEGEILMLIVTELAEACEWLRHGNVSQTTSRRSSASRKSLQTLLSASWIMLKPKITGWPRRSSRK